MYTQNEDLDPLNFFCVYLLEKNTISYASKHKKNIDF